MEDPSHLVLTRASPEDMGQYSCAGRNTAGEGEQSEGIFLDVQCKEVQITTKNSKEYSITFAQTLPVLRN